MEYRWVGRRMVDWELVVYDGESRLGFVRARNISSQGMMLDKGPLELTNGKLLELFCTVPFNNGHRVIRLQGQVIHSRGPQAGLMWTDRVDRASLDSSIHDAEMAGAGIDDPGSFRDTKQTAS